MSLLKNNREFCRKCLQKQSDVFENLCEGQKPIWFILACSDSRVSPTLITNSFLGDVFVHRNVSNIVDYNDKSFTAALYYALKHLQIEKLAVIGHSYCGGISAAREGVLEKEMAEWLDNISIDTAEVNPSHWKLEKKNVVTQVKRLKKHPVFIKYNRNQTVEGYLFHLDSGKLELLIEL